MRKLASVQVISSLEPIKGADRIELAKVLGWECIVAKNDGFKVGDKIIYVEVDSQLPERDEFEFMRARKFRVRTIKLRGQISQGLVLPMSLLKKDYEVGADVSEELGITKYDPQLVEENLWYKKLKDKPQKQNKFVKFMLRFEWFRNLYRKFVKTNEPFPTDIATKSDEIRCQAIPDKIKEWADKDILLTVTEKVDGSSATYILDDKKGFCVCSRNIWLRKEDDSPYWEIAKKYNIKKCLKALKYAYKAKTFVIQGEIIGSNIQKNKYGLKGYDFYVFNMVVDGERLPRTEYETLAQANGLKCVPLVSLNYSLENDVKSLVEYSKGKSVLADIQREGLVFRNEFHGISFKAINPEFLLKNEE